jgi:hypothetical protein
MPLIYQERLVQTAFTEISATTSTTSTTMVDLLTLTITTGANPVIAYCSMGSEQSATNGWVEVRLTIDGTVVGAGMAYHSVSSGNGNSGSFMYKSSPLTPGSHTFKIQYLAGAAVGGTVSITPSNTWNHATLYLEEVTF